MKPTDLKTIPLFLLLSILLAACGGINPGRNTPPTEIPPVQAETGVVVEGRIVPRKWVDISFATNGQVAEVLVSKGDQVKKGDVLARLGDREQIEAQVASAELELANAQKALNDLNDTAESQRVEALRRVSRATIAVRDAKYNLENFSIPTNQANLTAAEAIDVMRERLDAAYAAFEPYKYRSETDDTREEYLEKLDEAQGDLNAAVRRLDYENELSAAEADLNQARQDYEELKEGPKSDDIAIAEASVSAATTALEAAKANLENLDLVATIDGTITKFDLDPGEQVIANQTVAEIADLSQLYVETDNLTEIEVPKIAEGQSVTVIPDAIPDLELTGVVDEISKFFEEKRGDITYTTRILLNDLDPRLRWGMTVLVRFQEE